MNRRALHFGFVGAIVLASVVASLLIERHGQSQWREQQELLRKQAGKIAALTSENQRLAGSVGPSANARLASDEFRELLRLRGEIGPLRQSAHELPALRLTHRELLDAVKNRELAQDRVHLAYWPKGQLTRAGYADPSSALQTALCAMTEDDPETLLASVTPGVVATLSSSRFPGDSSADRISAATKTAADSMVPASGFSLVGQELNSPDQATLDVYFEGESATRVFVMKQITGQWKLDGIYPSQVAVAGGPMAWP
jgi:hypothetical protein